MTKAGKNTLAWMEVLKLHRVSLMFKLKYAKFCKEVRSLSCGPFLCTGINYSHKTNSQPYGVKTYGGTWACYFHNTKCNPCPVTLCSRYFKEKRQQFRFKLLALLWNFSKFSHRYAIFKQI